MRPAVRYSWILPIRDEARSLPQLIREIGAVMARDRYEVICVDDGSRDSTDRTLKRLRRNHSPLRILSFRDPVGKWAALDRGIRSARGGIIITIDADLQDDPREVRVLLRMVQKGYDLVSGWRRPRHDPVMIVTLSRLGNWLVSRVTRRAYHDLNSPMKVYRRAVLDHLPRVGTLLRFSLLFADELGFCTIEVPVVHRPRRWGTSKFGTRKYLRIFYDFLLVRLLFWGSGGIRKMPPHLTNGHN